MGLGQTLLTIMSLILMGRLVLNINGTTLDAGFAKDMAEYRITATSLGTSLLESANGLSFDEATVDTFLLVTEIGSLTDAATFGKDFGESGITSFDDVDDFDNYDTTEAIPNSATFKIHGKVEYIEVSGSTLSVTAAKRFNKLITVYVTSDYLVDYSVDPPRPDTLIFKSIYSYWYFR